MKHFGLTQPTPCPFCGSEVVVFNPDGMLGYKVECSNPLCVMGKQTCYQSHEEAVSAWDTRLAANHLGRKLCRMASENNQSALTLGEVGLRGQCIQTSKDLRKLGVALCNGREVDSTNENNPAVAAIQFALDTEDGLSYLRYWNVGEFDICRKNWPEAPDECYLGADPLLERQGITYS